MATEEWRILFQQLDWAIKHDVDIINMSYGFTKNYPELHKKDKKRLMEKVLLL